MTLRRRELIAGLGLAGTALAWPAAAQGSYPDRAITVVVPQGAGGANDAIARIVTSRLATVLGQPVVIENKAGAGGTIGTAYAAKAKPDGYTLLLTADSAHVINPALYKSIGFDPVKDFAPIGTVATAGYVLVANPTFPASTVPELIAHVKAAPPGSVSYASAGNGTLNHLIGEMLNKQGGIGMVHVPYRTSAAAVADVVGGQLPVSVQSLPSAIGFIKSGKLKVLGVVNQKRVAALPDVPTVGETLKGFGSTPWYGLLAPAGTPQPALDRLQAALAQTLQSKDVQDQLAAQGCEVMPGTSADFATLIRKDLPQWARLVQQTGAKVD